MDDSVAPVVAGYRLGALLGRGASAAVWSGRRVADGRAVAVKVVPITPDGDADAGRELGALRGLGGDHVVTLLDAVPVSDPFDALALVMDRYDGGSLGRVVAARGRLTAGEIVTALSPVAAALGGLHRAGVVHGDLTPGNILFDDTGRPAICDLGVTRIIGERTEEVFGTRGFVAPEVTMGEQPTPASDVYAVGALAWFCATGEAPEPGWLRQGTSAEALADLPAALVAVIDCCLAAEPSVRPSAVELSLDLFESAGAEPLQLPGAADDVDSLTRRIRAHALASAETGEPAATTTGDASWAGLAGWAGRWRRNREARPEAKVAAPASRRSGAVERRPLAPARNAAPAKRPTSTTPPAPPVPAPQPDGRHVARHASPPDPGAGRRRAPVVSGAATAVLAAVFVTVGGLVAVAAGWEPSDVLSKHSASVPQPGPGPTGTTQTRVGTTVTPLDAPHPPRVDLTSASAVVDSPLAAAQALADARADLWTSGDVAKLGIVDAPGSAAWTDDAERISEATEGGWRYQGVRFTVRTASVVRHTSTTASIRVVLDSAAYDVVGPHGPQHRAAATGQQLVLDLVKTRAGWRVSRVEA